MGEIRAGRGDPIAEDWKRSPSSSSSFFRFSTCGGKKEVFAHQKGTAVCRKTPLLSSGRTVIPDGEFLPPLPPDQVAAFYLWLHLCPHYLPAMGLGGNGGERRTEGG